MPEVVSVSVNVLMDLQHPVTAVPDFLKRTDRKTSGQTHRRLGIDDDSVLSAGGFSGRSANVLVSLVQLKDVLFLTFSH